jgi:phosphohistidine phosphatase
MQRQLVVLRHAKSDWNTDAPDDHSRPLNNRGKKDAPRVARRIAELGWTPEHVVSSDSRRTRETFERMNDEFSSHPQVVFLASLYHAGPRELSFALAEVPDPVTCAMAIGHNPGWEEVVYWLCGESTRMTTGNAALLTVEAKSWPEAMGKAGFWTLVDVIRPKDL